MGPTLETNCGPNTVLSGPSRMNVRPANQAYGRYAGDDTTDGESDAVTPQVRHYLYLATLIYPLQSVHEFHFWHDYKL